MKSALARWVTTGTLAEATTALCVPLVASPARAATCTTVTHTNTTGILTTTDGETPTASPSNASTATATLTTDGVVADLPDATAKVQWLVPTSTSSPVKLADVNGLRLRMRNEISGGQFTASYQLVINPSPADTTAGAVHFTTLVWEAYKNGYGAVSGFKTYVLDPQGPEGWWSTKTLPAIPGAVAGDQKAFTLKTYLAAYPDATVTAYGWNIGKGSPGLKTTVSALRFSTTAANGCTISAWTTPPVVVTPPAYTGPAVRKTPLIETRNWDHGNAGWIKPFHSSFEAELVADYSNVAPAGTPARTAQVKALADRNVSHTNGHGAPGQPLIFLLPTL